MLLIFFYYRTIILFTINFAFQQGTLGASGDLAPLAHLALGFLGEGKMWNPLTNTYEPADQVLRQFNLKPLE